MAQLLEAERGESSTALRESMRKQHNPPAIELLEYNITGGGIFWSITHDGKNSWYTANGSHSIYWLN